MSAVSGPSAATASGISFSTAAASRKSALGNGFVAFVFNVGDQFLCFADPAKCAATATVAARPRPGRANALAAPVIKRLVVCLRHAPPCSSFWGATPTVF